MPDKLPCFVWDAVGKSIGIWDGYMFTSIPEDYSFDVECSKGMNFFCEGSNELIGKITHWRSLLKPPEETK